MALQVAVESQVIVEHLGTPLVARIVQAVALEPEAVAALD
jgi:hypothetical protein